MENTEAGRVPETEAELEALFTKLKQAQLALGENAAATVKILNLALSIAGKNLVTMKDQMEQVRELAAQISRQTTTP